MRYVGTQKIRLILTLKLLLHYAIRRYVNNSSHIDSKVYCFIMRYVGTQPIRLIMTLKLLLPYAIPRYATNSSHNDSKVSVALCDT